MGTKNKLGRKKGPSVGSGPSSASPWTPISVVLPQEGAVGMTDGDDTDTGAFLTRNHYDDPKLFRKAAKDLPMNPGEDCAMFFGLEVLDASRYRVVEDGGGKSKRLMILDSHNETNNEGGTGSHHNHKQGDEMTNKTKKRKQDKADGESNPNKNDYHHNLTLTEQPAKKKKSKTAKAVESTQLHRDQATDPKSDSVEVDTPQLPDSNRNKSTNKKAKKKKKKSNKAEGEDATKGGGLNEPSSIEASTRSTKRPLHHKQMNETSSLVPVTPDQLAEIQSTWGGLSSGAHLHPLLYKSLYRLGFSQPTPIQAATLAASIMGRRNLVGAAPTGSGKTLAFLLPILNTLLETSSPENDDDNDQQEQQDPPKRAAVQALIMTPTRELASQIHTECDKLLPNQCATLVGGIALVKQARILQTKRPPIIIATPGRLWAMLTSGDHDHLKDLSQIRYLVLDEADRMTQEHSFPQLIKILDAIHAANPGEDDLEDDGDGTDDDENDDGRLHGLPGVPGEAQLTMLTDEILNHVDAQRAVSDPETREISDTEYSDDDDGAIAELEQLEEEIPEQWIAKPRVHRQTFIYSATLTLPYTSTKSSTAKPKVGKRGKKLGLQGGIAEILEKTRAMGETKVVDLSSSSSSVKTSLANQHNKSGVRLPPGLSLEQIKCTQRHKDSHLYAYLMTTTQGSSGPCLVFCNSIAGVRRVGATMQALGFTVRILHAHMQQRARFKAVESLKDSKSRAVVVCTDVAARGLDIPSVSTVIHYDAARSVDTFVHRSGRTARGMGEGAIGSSLSLIAPAEDKAHSKILESLNVSFTKVVLDGRLLTAAQERTNLASKIIAAAEMEQKVHSSNRWFAEKAKEAELELDDDLLEDDQNRPERESQQLLEAQKAKIRLAKLLAEPMRTQRYGKFLSTNSAAAQNELQQSSQQS